MRRPIPSIPDSLFVPFFSPDEPDSGNDDGDTYICALMVALPLALASG